MLGIVSLGVMQISQQATRVQKGTAQKFGAAWLISVVSSTLQDPTACANTLGPSSLGGAKMPLGAGSLVSEIKDKKNKTILRGNCTSGNLNPCIFGTGQDRTLVKSILIKEYNNSNAPYYNGINQSTLEIELIQGSGIGKWDSMTVDEKRNALQQTIGQIRIVKRITLNTTTDAANLIQSCITDKSEFLQSSCVQFGGTYVEAEKKCKNINIGTLNTNPAITVKGDLNISGNKLVTNTLNVGVTPGGSAGPGNLNAEGDLSVKGNITTEGELIMGTKGKFAPGTQTNSLQLLGLPNNDRVTLNLGNSNAFLKGQSNKVGVGTTGIPETTLDINGDALIGNSANIKNDLFVGTGGSASSFVEFGGNVAITRTGNNAMAFSGGNVSIAPPYNDENTNSANYIATQGWVIRQFLNKVGDQAISSLLNQILNDAATDTRVKQVKQNICLSFKNATWNGTECVMSSGGNCSTTQGLRGFDSNGNKVCQNLFKNTQYCSTNNPPDYVMTGVNSNGTIRCKRQDYYTSSANSDMKIKLYIAQEISRRLGICYAKYPPASGYSSIAYSTSSNRCSARRVSSTTTSSKGSCSYMWDRDSSSKCGCWSGWYWPGSSGCSFNWHTTGLRCNCRKDNWTNYSCAVSGNWCY